LDRLQRAEQVRKELALGSKAFQAQFERDLRTYRSQRAWKVMLFFRKAYALLIRPGWKGKARFLRWILSGRVADGLEEYELQFPDLQSYLPRELHAPFLDAAAVPMPAGKSPSRPPQRAYDVIVLPVFEFDFRFQRPQQLATEFARRGHRVFWISPMRTLPPHSGQLYEAVQLRANLWEIHLRVQPANIYLGRLGDEDVEAFSASLGQLVQDWAIAENCALLQLPFWRRIGLGLRCFAGSRIVYDCMDDWQTMPSLSDFNRSEENLLVRECDVLVVTGQQLLERHRDVARRAILVRNAADFEFFSSGRPDGRLAGIPKPMVGYFGAITDWFDYDLLYEAACARPQYSFVLIGGLGIEEDVMGDGIRKLRELPNVHALGHKNYLEIPSYLAEFDACIIPFVLNQVTRHTDPVKLYEYLSQGKPVVATALGELGQCGDLIYIASGPGDFAGKLDRALSENDPQLRRRRIEFAASHTWPQRFGAIDAAIKEAFPLVSIVTVTYNSGEFVRPCLDSLRRDTFYPACEIIAVDNNSQDGTRQIVAEFSATDPRIRLIGNVQNMGFAAANNLGLRQARGEYLILLNADAMVTSGWIERLLRHCRRDPSIGVIVPVTNSAGNEAKINVPYTHCGEMEEFALEVARENLGKVLEIAVGPLFCALIPRTVWEKVGELDERFETGMFEDDDYSLRVRRAGFRVVAAEDCFVHHFGQGAFSKLSRPGYEQVFERNRRRFEEKWGMPWTPHQYRPGIRPEGGRFTPAEFVGPQKSKPASARS
jgi:GT2 family glycosyltransferase/glycosyltransferase involved in cell wall biosynthesis